MLNDVYIFIVGDFDENELVVLYYFKDIYLYELFNQI
jgi:hypothetical protein